MAQKRKTLPSDFNDIIKNGSLDELKSVFEKCDINAYGGYNKGNALFFDDIDEAFIRWAAAEGIDVNFEDTWHDTPIIYQAKSNPSNVKILIELGADIEKKDKYNNTPFGKVVSNCIPNEEKYLGAVKCLVENGADIHVHCGKYTPLEKALGQCRGIQIPAMLKVATYLISLGTKITPSMRESVRTIGESFEFYRPNFNKDLLTETDKDLQGLYKLFEVDPVTQREVYDGKSPIQVKASSLKWQKQFEELWDMLVPGLGHASTVQGEVIRITGKVRREISDNGAGNWNKDFKKLPQALSRYFSMGTALHDNDLNEASTLAKSISANSDDDDLNKLCKYAVKWVLLNPDPILLDKVDYDR